MTKTGAKPRYLQMRTAAKILWIVAGVAVIVSFVLGISREPELQAVARNAFLVLGILGAAIWGRSFLSEAIDRGMAADLESSEVVESETPTADSGVKDLR